MKSYLTGNPALKLILNDDVTLAQTNMVGSVVLDDCNFHESVQHNEFVTNKALKITPPSSMSELSEAQGRDIVKYLKSEKEKRNNACD